MVQNVTHFMTGSAHNLCWWKLYCSFYFLSCEWQTSKNSIETCEDWLNPMYIVATMKSSGPCLSASATFPTSEELKVSLHSRRTEATCRTCFS